MTENRDGAKRAAEPKAEASFALHTKQIDGTRFKIKIDAAGNILTNKLRVTSMVKSLMELYVDIAQIHYEDDDWKFVVVEKAVRKCFEFDPPLKPGWFPDYMRKKLEKSRSVFQKHYDKTGRMHPDCPPKKHSTLLAWWSSLVGSSKSQSLREMNSSCAVQRRTNSIGRTQSRRLPVFQSQGTMEVERKDMHGILFFLFFEFFPLYML
jgi:hypothetical protein